MTTHAYAECLKAMYSMRRFGIILGLSTISNILAGLGNPQQTFSAIHIAGTNGKGSVASSLATILQKAGYRVGLYTSPHLIRFNERICINGTPISDDAWWRHGRRSNRFMWASANRPSLNSPPPWHFMNSVASRWTGP